MTRIKLSALLGSLGSVVLAGLLFGQGQDRGIITGLVTDSTGAAVPDATVTITNEATSFKTAVNTSSVGNYSTPPLILGTYTVQVEKEGFKVFVQKGIPVTSGFTYRLDTKLELGAVSQTVEVKATTTLINVATPEVAHVLGEKYYRDLPVVMGSDIRLAESLLAMQPGYVPLRPNGDPIFRGSQFMSRMNGGQTMAMENYLDGASFGSAIDHNNTQERSVPYDSVREMKIIDSTFSAQYGRTSGGFVEYTTKSGTSKFHGSVYDYYNYQGLNARGELVPDRAPERKNNWGFVVGGPVAIPKIYDGRKHQTFFFTNLDILHFSQGALPSYGNTNPLPAFLQGDFSAVLNTSQLVGTDILKRPIYSGEIFNPATTRRVLGVPVRDGYGFDPITGLPITGSANIIPQGDPLRSGIAAKLGALIPAPDRPGLTFNSIAPSGNKYINPKTLFIRIDQSVGANLKMSTSVNINTRPSLRQCTSFSKGCDFTSPATYFGEGFYQDITTRTVHQQFDWIIKPNLFNHTTVSFDRWVLPAHPVSAGQHWVSKLGLKGPISDLGGAPRVAFSSPNIPYSHYGESDYIAEGDIANRWQFLDDITWVRGRHTVKAGIEYRHHQFPFIGDPNVTGSYNFSWQETAGWNASGNQLTQTGDPVASFLLGQVDNANFNINYRHLLREYYLAPWVNDEFKVTNNLTLTLGLRFDYQGCLSDAYGGESTFDPNTPNPGAGGLPGAMIFAGTGPGRTGKQCFEVSPHDAWGPRFGFAYRINDQTSIRGGYGIYYGGISANQFTGFPELGFSTNPTVPNLTSGYAPAFYWEDGFPQSVIKFPPAIDPTIGNNQGPTWVTRDSKNLPRYQNYSLTVERQFKSNLLFDVSYIGNHGTRLPLNAPSMGILDNMNNPTVLNLGAAVLGADINSRLAQAAGIKPPWPGFQGGVAQALRLWPQFTNLNFKSVPTGYSTYNSVTFKLEKRFSSGLNGRVAYTISKLINNGAEDTLNGDGSGIQNPALGQADKRGLSRDDLPQSLILGWSYELPFGRGKRFARGVSGPLDKLIGGWQIAATQRYDSGRPLGISMACDFCSYIFSSGKRPNRVGPGQNSSFPGGHFDPNRDRYLLAGGWADPGPLQFGNASLYEPNIRNFGYHNEDVSINKDTRITERVGVRFETQFGNAFNRHLWCDPDTNWSSPTFGEVFAQCDVPRKIQFGLRLEF